MEEIEEKLNNVLGYLTAMSFDNPELANTLEQPLNELSEATELVNNIEAMRQSRIGDPKELADKAVKDYEASEVHKSTSSSFTQAERLKSLFEELGIAVECGNDEDDSFIMVLDWVFYFKNGAFKNVKVI